MIGGHIERFCKTYFGMNAPGLAQYPDFFAVCLILLLSGKTAHNVWTLKLSKRSEHDNEQMQEVGLFLFGFK